jgi:hypothetical protein
MARAFVHRGDRRRACAPFKEGVVEKKSDIEKFNELIEQIRAGRGRELVPEGKTEVSFKDPQVTGLSIRVHKSGEASWSVRYKALGRSKKITKGNVKLVDRAKAIKPAKDMLADVQLNRADPIAAKKERMSASKVIFKDVAARFIAVCAERLKAGTMRRGTVRMWKRYLGLVERPRVSDARSQIKYVKYLDSLHNEALADITTEQMQLLIDQIAERHGKQMARSCRTVLKQFSNGQVTGRVTFPLTVPAQFSR